MKMKLYWILVAIFAATGAMAQVTTNPTATGVGIDLSTMVTGTLATTRGGTGGATTATSGRYLKGNGSTWATSTGSASGTGACAANSWSSTLNSDAAPTCTQPAAANLSDGTMGAGSVALGTVFTTPAYNAGDFTAATGSWTVDAGDVVTYQYQIVGKMMTVIWDIGPTTVSATPVTLRIAIPASKQAAKTTSAVAVANDNGAAQAATFVQISATGTVIYLYPTIAGTGNWSAATNATTTRGQISFEIQ